MLESVPPRGAPLNATTGTDYDLGFEQVTREVVWARRRGWNPTERQLTVTLMRAARIYAAVRGGKTVAGQSPEWLRGRLDALRAVLRQRATEARQRATEARERD
ncbi:MAG TPA: hypothetical protein VGR57_03195 [Ktedonobacterales bacterium]|nr:hypothetical protein [Ktedonobacterales bacterium]